MTKHVIPSELLGNISGELIQLAEIIEGLGEALCSDEQVLSNHLAQLQSVDLVSQSLRCQAGLLTSDNAIADIEKVNLLDLQQRLSKGLDCLR